jgi:GTP-binding protein
MLKLRNIAIIAHVDHGKTTLVDQMIKQAHLLRDNQAFRDCMLDSNDLERERGITILAKNISIRYNDYKINLIDTPGHSDFGGQVERVLKLADGVLLLVDAAEGPMPQTRFVLDKALQLKLKPIVIVNKLDKPDARARAVLAHVYDLFIELGADDRQLDFPVLYASGRSGWADPAEDGGPRNSILPLMNAIIDHIPPPTTVPGPVQMQIATLDYSEYVGRIGIGRVFRGDLNVCTPLALVKRDGTVSTVQVKQLFTFEGLERKETDLVPCGDLCAVTGIEGIDISDTITDIDTPEALPPIAIDEPTISMIFRVNDSPLFGQEGRFVTSRHLRERLFNETERDVALRVEEVNGEAFKVCGRGLLHLSILIENMRREGYEMTVSQPHVIYKMIDGKKQEPCEELSVDCPSDCAGRIIELVGVRRGEMQSMQPHRGRTMMVFSIPTRGLIGLRSKMMTASGGEAIMAHRFTHYMPVKGSIPHRINGVMISMEQGKAVAYAIDALQLRGQFLVGVGDTTYEGMIVGEHCKEGDIIVNLQRGKQLTNMRAAGSDRNMKIAPPIRLSLEEALEFIADDELVEATPKSLRMRKRFLTENDRRRQRRSGADKDDGE